MPKSLFSLMLYLLLSIGAAAVIGLLVSLLYRLIDFILSWPFEE